MAKARFGLVGDVGVQTCYEAGRDGFWLHRWFEAAGIANLVVDSSSIEVNRRARRAKTDRLDASKLLGLLLRWAVQQRWPVLPKSVKKERIVDNANLFSFTIDDADMKLIAGLDRGDGVAWGSGDPTRNP